MVSVSGRISRNLLCLVAACACASAGPAFAGPTGPVVSAGRASYDPATLTVISASTQTHIAWQSFNVAAGEVVNFIQPTAQSSVLNHIFNPQSLDILGGLHSNGSVFFLTDGRVSGPGVNLNLAGMINTSLRLPKMALAFSGGSARPAPPLTRLADGSIYVISEDEQAVTRSGGDVMLNPGKAVELAHASMPSLRVGLTAPESEAINLSRLLGSKRETGIFAGLFRVPAAARRAVQRDAEPVMVAAAQAPFTDDERFYAFAVLYTQMRREALRRDAAMMQVAALSGSGVFLRGAKSRPSLLPREIQIGASATRVQEQAVRTNAPPVLAEAGSPENAPKSQSLPVVTVLARASAEPPAEIAAAPSAQSMTLALASAEPPAKMVATRGAQPNTLALASAEPPAEMAAVRNPQPIALASAPAEPPAELLASQSLRAVSSALAPASAEAPAETVAARASPALRDGDANEAEAEVATELKRPRSAPAVTVVALAQHAVVHAPQQSIQLKEVLIERRAPRYFTDYRGAMFFM